MIIDIEEEAQVEVEKHFEEADLKCAGRLNHVLGANKWLPIHPEQQKSLKPCATACLDNEVECPFRECKHWIEHQKDLNCDLISIDRHGEMTLRQIAERLNVSFVRIKQIQDSAIKKLSKRIGIIGQ